MERGAGRRWRARIAAPWCRGRRRRPPIPRLPIVEQDLEAALRNPASGRGWGGERHEVKCQSCQAISVFVDSRVAQRCDFCGSPSITRARVASGRHHAAERAAVQVQRRPGPRAHAQMVRLALVRAEPAQVGGADRHAARRLPALLDVRCPRRRALAGRRRLLLLRNRDLHRANGQTQMRQVRRVRWEPAAGSLEHFFDDALVPGTHGVHAGTAAQDRAVPDRDRPQALCAGVRARLDGGALPGRPAPGAGGQPAGPAGAGARAVRPAGAGRHAAQPAGRCRAIAAAPSSTCWCRSGW